MSGSHSTNMNESYRKPIPIIDDIYRLVDSGALGPPSTISPGHRLTVVFALFIASLVAFAAAIFLIDACTHHRGKFLRCSFWRRQRRQQHQPLQGLHQQQRWWNAPQRDDVIRRLRREVQRQDIQGGIPNVGNQNLEGATRGWRGMLSPARLWNSIREQSSSLMESVKNKLSRDPPPAYEENHNYNANRNDNHNEDHNDNHNSNANDHANANADAMPWTWAVALEAQVDEVIELTYLNGVPERNSSPNQFTVARLMDPSFPGIAEGGASGSGSRVTTPPPAYGRRPLPSYGLEDDEDDVFYDRQQPPVYRPGDLELERGDFAANPPPYWASGTTEGESVRLEWTPPAAEVRMVNLGRYGSSASYEHRIRGYGR